MNKFAPNGTALPEFADIVAAARRLDGLAVRTPLLESHGLNDRIGARILFKAEVLQRTGSFKFRGAHNRICGLDEAERKAGVVAFSSGNHGQGVAESARLSGVSAVVAMPADTPAIKLRNVAASGAEIVTFDRFRDDRDTVVAPYVEAGRTLVHPFDDPLVIAGQGTVGLEIAEQAEALGAAVDLVIVPCGGGGLTSGIALALAERAPNSRLMVAEPDGHDDTKRSLEAGRRIRNEDPAPSICDSILTPEPGVITFEINRRALSGAVSVSDAQAAEAMGVLADYLKLVVEPGAATPLAAILSGKVEVRGQTVVVVLSGGNVDLSLYSQLVGA